jgi:GT2 family glycosyltransferase
LVGLGGEGEMMKSARERELEKQNQKLQKELNTYKLHYCAAISQRDELAAELEESRECCKNYQESFSWKITKPFRFISRSLKKLIQKSSAGRYFLSGLRSLRKDGVRKTWDKVLLHFSKKRRIKNFGERFYLTGEERLKQEQTMFQKKIKFSILVPLYNTPLKFLEEMIESVRMQTYKVWELCLADGSDAGHRNVEKYCLSLQKKDARIRYKKLEKNSGISENTNACIEISTGEYIGLFDHDDLLHPSALYEMMCAIEKENPDFLYTDEATFEKVVTNIITAHFKPDYAVDTLRGNNYICHFSVFKRSLLTEAGWFRKEYDGSQDHDLILRLTAKAKKVYHIPKLLYYWRSHPASVAADINSKTYAIDAGKRAVKDSIEACGEKVTVESSKAFPTIYRLKYKIKGNPLISILIPCKDHAEDTEICIESILQKSTYKNYEILLVDNGSVEKDTMELFEKLAKNKRIRILHWNHPFNYSEINNYAAKEAGGEYLLLLNNDTEVITPGWMEEMLMYAQREDVGAVGAKLYYGDDTIQHAGIILGMGMDGIAGHAHYRQPKENLGYMGRLYYAQDMSAVTAACMMVKRAVYEELNGFDEAFEVAYNDVDFCMRLRKEGYLNVFTPYAELYHYESKSRGLEDTKDKRKRFEKEVKMFKERWKKELEEGDPYFNPNFDLMRDDFAVKSV